MTHANTKYVGRFAPSPTGPLHFGSLVAAAASYLDARAQGGTWQVRIEDVDTTRCNPQFAHEILATLSAFGFVWDGEVLVQSQRSLRYQAALNQLAARNLTYACACSRKEIADSALSGIDGPVYPGTCRDKSLPRGRHAVRVRTTQAEIRFADRVQGECCQVLERDIGDFVLMRRDGLFAYQLAVVIDDADQGVTHVVRGADLLDSTARQIYLQRLLGLRTPATCMFQSSPTRPVKSCQNRRWPRPLAPQTPANCFATHWHIWAKKFHPRRHAPRRPLCWRRPSILGCGHHPETACAIHFVTYADPGS